VRGPRSRMRSRRLAARRRRLQIRSVQLTG
jgi:hypothetical protein